MSSIETPKDHRFPWYVRLLFCSQRRRYGAILEPARLWGRTPRVFAALALLYGALDRRSSPLDPALRSLVTVRVSQINWCAFCVDINAATLIKRGVDEAKLAQLADFEASELYTQREKSALAYAEAVTHSNQQPGAKDFERLRAHFDDDAIIELTALIAFQNLSSKFNAAIGVQSKGFCSIMSTSPLSTQRQSTTDSTFVAREKVDVS
jgi:AhpD family alkylhydroperoxidase